MTSTRADVVKTIDRDEPSAKLKRDSQLRIVTSISEWAYRAKHIRGPEHFNTPEDLFSSRRPDEEIVVYWECRGQLVRAAGRGP